MVFVKHHNVPACSVEKSEHNLPLVEFNSKPRWGIGTHATHAHTSMHVAITLPCLPAWLLQEAKQITDRKVPSKLDGPIELSHSVMIQ